MTPISPNGVLQPTDELLDQTAHYAFWKTQRGSKNYWIIANYDGSFIENPFDDALQQSWGVRTFNAHLVFTRARAAKKAWAHVKSVNRVAARRLGADSFEDQQLQDTVSVQVGPLTIHMDSRLGNIQSRLTRVLERALGNSKQLFPDLTVPALEVFVYRSKGWGEDQAGDYGSKLVRVLHVDVGTTVATIFHELGHALWDAHRGLRLLWGEFDSLAWGTKGYRINSVASQNAEEHFCEGYALIVVDELRGWRRDAILMALRGERHPRMQTRVNKRRREEGRVAGSWGYLPWESDGPGDNHWHVLEQVNTKPVWDELKKQLKKIDGQKSDQQKLHKQWAWIGTVYLAGESLWTIPKEMVKEAIRVAQEMLTSPVYGEWLGTWKHPDQFPLAHARILNDLSVSLETKGKTHLHRFKLEDEPRIPVAELPPSATPAKVAGELYHGVGWPGSRVVWQTINNERFVGRIHEWDSGVLIVDCDDGLRRAVESDGVVLEEHEHQFQWKVGTYGYTTLSGDTTRHWGGLFVEPIAELTPHDSADLIPHDSGARISVAAAVRHKTPMASEVATRFAVKSRYKKKREVPRADGKGKTVVYEYSEEQVQRRNREKAKRIEKLRTSIGKLRDQVESDLRSDDPKTRLTALAVALMDETYERVGNEGSAKEGHFGVTGWQAKHVKFSGSKATITYVGKSGVSQKKEITTSSVVSALKKALKGKSGTDQVLCDGDKCRVLARDVNSYLQPHNITAKDIRGFHANEEVKSRLKAVRSQGGKLPSDEKERAQKLKAEFKQALEEAAEAVGHKASTLKGQYLVPGVEDEYLRSGKVKTRHAYREPKFGPNTPLMEHERAKVKYRMKFDSNGIFIAVYYGRKKIGGMNAFQKSYPEREKACSSDVWALLERYPQVEDTSRPRWVPDDGVPRTRTRALQVFKAFITDDSKHRLGIGKAMYRAVMAEWFAKVGPFLFMPMKCSGSGTSTEAQRVWKSLARDFPSSGTVIAVLRRPSLPADAGRVASRWLKTAIININNTWPQPPDHEDGKLTGMGGLLSSLTAYERALVNDMVRSEQPILLTADGYTFNGYSVDEGAVSELQGAGYLGEEENGQIKPSIELEGKLSLYKTGTKSPAEKEDEEVERLSRPMPKKKPPRKDKRRERIKEHDPDLDSKDKDLSRNYKDSSVRVAVRFLSAGPVRFKVINQDTGNEEWITEEQGKKNPSKYKLVEPKGKKTEPDDDQAETGQGPDEKSDDATETGQEPDDDQAETGQEPDKPEPKVQDTPVAKAEHRLDLAKEHLKTVESEVAQAQEEAAAAVELLHQNSNADADKRERLEADAKTKEEAATKAEARLETEKGRIEKLQQKLDKVKGQEADAAAKYEAAKQQAETVALVDQLIGEYVGKGDDPTALKKLGEKSYEQFSKAKPDHLEAVARQLSEQMSDSEDREDLATMHAILDGLELATLMAGGDFDIEGRDTPSRMMRRLAAALNRNKEGSEKMLLGIGRGLEGGSGEKARAALSMMSDDDLIAVVQADSPEHPFHGLAKLMWDKNKGPDHKKLARTWMENAVHDSVVLLGPITRRLAEQEATADTTPEQIEDRASELGRELAAPYMGQPSAGGDLIDQFDPEAGDAPHKFEDGGLQLPEPGQEDPAQERVDALARVLEFLDKKLKIKSKAMAGVLALSLMQGVVNTGDPTPVDRGILVADPNKVQLKNGSTYDLTPWGGF